MLFSRYKIVGLFASGTNIGEYLRRIGEEIIKRHYSGGSEVAHKYYNLNCFPFVLGANLDKEYLDNGIVKVKLADSTNHEVTHNLKVHFANEFKKAVRSKVVARLQKLELTKEEAYEWVEKTVGTRAIGVPYLYYIAFNDEYFEWERECDEDPSETFEMLKEMYIQEFNSRLEECGLKSSDFYEYKDDILYIKDVSDKVVKSVARYVKKEVALDFRTPGSVESKVENCKNVLSELIYQSTGKSIYGYDYDDFTDEKKIRNGSSFALIPFIKENGQLKSLSSRDASKINGVFNKEIPNVDGNFISDIRGKTANPQFANCKEPVYAFSNKQIALLLPMIMESPIAYNEKNGRFEFAVDLGNFRQQCALPTPPPTPVPNRHPNSDEESVPRSTLSHSQVASPRQGTGSGSGLLRLVENQLNVAVAVAGPSARMSSIVVNPGISGPSSQSLSAAQNVPATWSHDPWPLQSTSGNQWQSSPEPGTSGLSWRGAAQNVQASTNLWTQQPNPWSLQSTSENKWPLPQQSFSGPIRFSSRGSRLPLYARPLSVHSEDSGLGSSRPASTSSTVYSRDSGFGSRPPSTFYAPSPSVCSADSGYESRPSSTFTDMSNDENQKELTEKELIINKFLKNVKEIAAKNIEEKKTLEKEKIHEYIEGFSKLGKGDQTYQYCISFDEEYFKGKKSCPKAVFDIFRDNYITVLDSAFKSCNPEDSGSHKYKNDKFYIKDINVIKKIAENAHMADRESSPEWIQRCAKAGANISEEEKKLIDALLYRFNCSNDGSGVHTSFTLEDGKIVGFLDVDKEEYLRKVRNGIIKKHCGTEEVARKVYDLGQFPFVFPPNPQRDKGGKIIIAHNIDDAIFNLKIHLIQDFRIQVEEEVAKKLEEMGVTGAYERIKESAYLAAKSKDPQAWYIYFDDKPFQGGSELFKELKKIYIETFKSRWKECGLDDSLVSYGNGVLYIENAIDINVVKKIGEYEDEQALGFDRRDTGGRLPKRKSPEPLAGSNTTKKPRSESGSSSSEEQLDSPPQGLTDPTLEQVREQFGKASI